MTTNEQLAHKLKAWRTRAKLSRVEAAPILGIPFRTLQNIEQGRGFPYPALLLHFINTVNPKDQSSE